MRYWLFAGLLALSGCGKASEPAPAARHDAPGTPPSEASAAPALPSDSAGRALLEDFVTPRQKGAYAPRDDCGKLPGAAEFRRALAAAVAARDAEGIAALAEPRVKLGFGGDDGRDRLRAKLTENKGELMKELDALLRLGCAADAQGGLTMPWYFAQDLGDVDSTSAMLVTGVDVPVHAGADPASAVTRRLSWDLVMLDTGLYPDKPLQQVTTTDGSKGWVATDKLRSMLDYRLLASRGSDGWRISAIVAGD